MSGGGGGIAPSVTSSSLTTELERKDLFEFIYHLIKGNPKFPTEELEANSAKVKSVSKQFPPSVTPIEGKGRKASNSR